MALSEWTYDEPYGVMFFAGILLAVCCGVLSGPISAWLRRRAIRRLREGDEIVLWPACDLREDHLVTDLSRLAGEGLVGIRCRLWGVLGVARRLETMPDYPDEVRYVKAESLWVCWAYLESRAERLGLSEGKVVTMWAGGEHEEECLVVDMSRLQEGLVGIRPPPRKKRKGSKPDDPNRVEYVSAQRVLEAMSLSSRNSSGTD